MTLDFSNPIILLTTIAIIAIVIRITLERIHFKRVAESKKRFVNHHLNLKEKTLPKGFEKPDNGDV